MLKRCIHETRLAYLMRVAIHHIREHAAEEVSPVVEAEVVDAAPDDDMQDPALLDFLDQIQGCKDGASLTQLVKPANDGFEGAKQEIAKRAIANKAKELGVKWSKGKGVFEA